MSFDIVSKIEYESQTVDYGYIKGNDKIVYIKAGMGGSYLGYDDKYLKIAHRLNEKYGCSVICVSNPVPLPIIVDQMILGNFIKEYEIKKPKMFFFGHSNGGIKGLELGASGVRFTKMVLVNMPLMMNFHKTARWMDNIPETNIVTVYGEKDPSYRYIPFLEAKNLQNVEIVKIAGADHNFKGMMEQFIELSEMILK
jgi:hypothetical protein